MISWSINSEMNLKYMKFFVMATKDTYSDVLILSFT